MTTIAKKILNPIHQVIIYKGHEKNRLLGPYPENIIKRIDMFKGLNHYRKEIHRPEWKVTVAAGEELVDVLKDNDPKKTLLVIPAGQSSHLDKVFSLAEDSFIENQFFKKGGRGYFNCGSAYRISEKRIYHDLCTEAKEEKRTIVKISNLPLFKGVSEGPLCPYPGKKYKVGFFSDAVTVTDGKNPCTIYLSGGGSFFPNQSAQKVKVLVKYLPKELERLGKPLPECTKWENAGIMVSVGEGAALLSMFHPYYGPNDFDVPTYEQAFPECGTDWRAVKERLSPLDTRMRFVLNSMLSPLEDLDWS